MSEFTLTVAIVEVENNPSLTVNLKDKSSKGVPGDSGDTSNVTVS